MYRFNGDLIAHPECRIAEVPRTGISRLPAVNPTMSALLHEMLARSFIRKLDPKSLPACALFNPPTEVLGAPAGSRAPTWGDIKRP
jgi:hypothetical protein